VGRADDVLLPLDDVAAPRRHTLFSVGRTGCLLDFRPEWRLRVFRDEVAITGHELIDEGTAFRRGRRVLIQMAPGTRGSLQLGHLRLLFKWEEVPGDDVGDVPLRDVGDVPRCHACGLALRDALPREGLYARCDSCRAMNCFVDPEGPYRTANMAAQDFTGAANEDSFADSLAPGMQEEADTLLGVPIFAPMTGTRMEALPEHLRPAGVAGAPATPPDLVAVRAPRKALEGLKTMFDRSPFLGPRPHRKPDAPGAKRPRPPQEMTPLSTEPLRTEPTGSQPPLQRDEAPPPASAAPEVTTVPGAQVEPLDDAFWTAEVEAMLPFGALEAPEEIVDGEEDSGRVAWGTFSVLSAWRDSTDQAGRVPRGRVRRLMAEAEDIGTGSDVGWLLAAVVAIGGVAILVVGLWMLRPMQPETAAPAPAPTTPVGVKATPAPAPVARVDRVEHGPGTYARRTGDAPESVHTGRFWIDRKEVQLGEWRAFAARTGRPDPGAWAIHLPGDDLSVPVSGISAAEAAEYCKWTGGRLPTEAEWERAAVGLEGRAWPWGPEFDEARVSISDALEPVGSHPRGASGTGVLDLVGSVPEWVQPASGEPLLKGGGVGAWAKPEYLSPFARVPGGAERWAPGPGFRCASD